MQVVEDRRFRDDSFKAFLRRGGSLTPDQKIDCADLRQGVEQGRQPDLADEPGNAYQQDLLSSERSEEHTSELQSRLHLVCRLLLEKKKKKESNAVRLQTTSPKSRALYTDPANPLHAPERLVYTKQPTHHNTYIATFTPSAAQAGTP